MVIAYCVLFYIPWITDMHKMVVGYVVAQLIEALRYKVEGCSFDSQWGHWDFY
jgi:hypothetical protein